MIATLAQDAQISFAPVPPKQPHPGRRAPMEADGAPSESLAAPMPLVRIVASFFIAT
jgi:hypothetical protein